MNKYAPDNEPTPIPNKRFKIKDAGEWGWRLICTALLILNLYAKANYVSRDIYERDMEKMNRAIIELTEAQKVQIERDKVNDRQDETLKDHEMRIRLLELKK